MKMFPFECKAQNRAGKIASDLASHSIVMTDLKGYKIPRALGKIPYVAGRREFLNSPERTLKYNRDWLVWNNGQSAIKDLNPVYVDYNDILNLHAGIFSNNVFFNFVPEPGKLRTGNAETNPETFLSCDSRVLDDKTYDVLFDYDLRSLEGYPLLEIEDVTLCKDKNYSSATLIYYKEASIKAEFLRWVIDFNDTLYRYETLNTDGLLSPYAYLADMRRWFLALKPFNDGNAEVVDALIDYATTRLNLPPLNLNDSINPIFLPAEEYRSRAENKISDTLSFFDGCLFEVETKYISPECMTVK
jgi:hypothetical protein